MRREDPLPDAGDHTVWCSAAVVFQVQLTIVSVENLFDRLPQWLRLDRKFEAERGQTALRQERDRERYDEGREAARLSLLEQRSRLGHELAELAGWRTAHAFQLWPRQRARLRSWKPE